MIRLYKSGAWPSVLGYRVDMHCMDLLVDMHCMDLLVDMHCMDLLVDMHCMDLLVDMHCMGHRVHMQCRDDSRFAPSQWETVLLCKQRLSFAGRKPRISPAINGPLSSIFYQMPQEGGLSHWDKTVLMRRLLSLVEAVSQWQKTLLMLRHLSLAETICRDLRQLIEKGPCGPFRYKDARCHLTNRGIHILKVRRFRGHLTVIMEFHILGPVFCLLLGVSSDYAEPITDQVTEVTCPVIGRAQPERTPSKGQKTAPGRKDGLYTETGLWSVALYELYLVAGDQRYNTPQPHMIS